MKKVKLNFALLAMVLATGAAVANTRPKLDDVKWRPLYDTEGNITGWDNIDGEEQGTDYDCDLQVQEVCSSEFPQNVTPTASTPPPAGSETGRYN